MSKAGTLYIEQDSPIQKMDGSIKFLLIIFWTSSIFLFQDLRVFIAFFLVGILLLRIAKIPFSSLKPLFIFIILFTIMNSVLLIIITPQFGSGLAHSNHSFFKLKAYDLSYETLWFALTLSMKYLSIFPIMMLFIFTTHPSKFASSLNKIGVSYKVAYAINIALRYIPDIKDEFVNIMHAQEARGLSFRKKDANMYTRLKNYNAVLIPLVLSSLNKIELISNAMDLRGFGKYKKRTWYSWQAYKKRDFLALVLMVLVLLICIALKSTLLSSFWYPFS